MFRGCPFPTVESTFNDSKARVVVTDTNSMQSNIYEMIYLRNNEQSFSIFLNHDGVKNTLKIINLKDRTKIVQLTLNSKANITSYYR